jgi:hypothetical protein
LLKQIKVNRLLTYRAFEFCYPGLGLSKFFLTISSRSKRLL